MKKIIIFCCLCLLIICGCDSRKTEIKPYAGAIEFTCEINHYNEYYECNAKITEKKEIVFDLTLPENLNGLKLNYNKNGVTADFHGLEFNFGPEELPCSSALNVLNDIIAQSFSENTVLISEKKSIYFDCKTDGADGRIYFAETGLPLSAQCRSKGVSAIFKNVKIS